MSDGHQRLKQSLLASIKAQLVVDLFVVPAIEDYIVARWSYINGLDRQFLWSSLQCIEKMLKAFLIANEVDTRGFSHRIGEMADTLCRQTNFNSLAEDFKTFQNHENLGIRNPIEFIKNIERQGSPRTRYRLEKTLVYFNDLHRLDETYSRLSSFKEPIGLFGGRLPPASFREHTQYTEAVKEALLHGNLSFDVPDRKPLQQTARIKQSPAAYPEDPLSLRGEAMNWLRGLAKI